MHHDNYASAIFSYAFHQIYTNGEKLQYEVLCYADSKVDLNCFGPKFQIFDASVRQIIFYCKAINNSMSH